MRITGTMILAGFIGLPAGAGANEYPPALLDHFMKARNLTDRALAAQTVDVKARPDVDLDGKPDYLVKLRHGEHLCSYAVYRSGGAYAGNIDCCKWDEKKKSDHIEFVCRDSANMDTDKGTIAWRAVPWSYGDASLIPRPGEARGQEAQGVAALKAGHFKEARLFLGKAILNGKPTAQLQYEYALAVKGTGDIGVARMALDDALTIDPKFEPALLAYADWYWETGNKQAAARAYSEYLAVAKDPVGIERARKRAQ